MSDIETRLAQIKALMEIAENTTAKRFIGLEGYKNIINDIGRLLPPVPDEHDDDLVKMIGRTIADAFHEGAKNAPPPAFVCDPRDGSIQVKGTFSLDDLARAVLVKLRAEGVIR